MTKQKTSIRAANPAAQIPASTQAAKGYTRHGFLVNQSAAELLTDEQTAALLSVEPRTLRLWRHTRGLPHIKITSKVIRYKRNDIEAWLNRARTVIA